MLKIQFPHINRKLTAALLFILLTSLVIPNLAQNRLFPASDEKKLRFQLLRNPESSNLHEKLGQYYLATDEKTAEREYLLAQEYYLKNIPPDEMSILESRYSPWQTWQNLIGKKHAIENEREYWEMVNQTHPDYLYAYLKLALFNWQMGETQKAREFLELILTNDPTNQSALKLLGEIK